MKKGILLLLTALLVLPFSACERAIEGDAALIEKAREEIPLTDIENTEISIAGTADTDDLRLVWFVTGDDAQEHSYFPLEFEKKGGDKLTFAKAYPAYTFGRGLAAYPWHGYTFLIDQPKCKSLALRYADGSEEVIEVGDELPFVFSTAESLTAYFFLDENSEEI